MLDVLRRVGVPKRIQVTVAGESLFNDGVGVVIFTLMLALATGNIAPGLSAPVIAGLFLLNAIGGGLLGLGLGYLAFLLLRKVDDYNVELIISLALVTATYSIAGMLDVSGPVAVVVAGILIGNYGMHLAMSETTREHIRAFWRMVDQTLNAILFLLIGLEIAAIELTLPRLATMAAMIPSMLLIRWCSAAASALPLHPRLPDRFPALIILTWGGCVARCFVGGDGSLVARQPLERHGFDRHLWNCRLLDRSSGADAGTRGARRASCARNRAEVRSFVARGATTGHDHARPAAGEHVALAGPGVLGLG